MKKLNKNLTKWKKEAKRKGINFTELLEHLNCDITINYYPKDTHKYTCIYLDKLVYCNAVIIKCVTCDKILAIYKRR